MDQTRRFGPRSLVCLLVTLSWGTTISIGQPAELDRRWDGYRFLLGAWVGEGTGSPGQGTGEFTFAFDLGKHILQRKNVASYPATKDRPAFTHEDLMIVFFERGSARAVYFDNEDHVIRYAVSVSADSASVTFLSDSLPSTPRFRLTYTRGGADRVAIAFDIAPPNAQGTFSRYIQATARRKP